MYELRSINMTQDIQRLFELQKRQGFHCEPRSTRERIERLNRIDNYLHDRDNLARLCEAMHRDLGKPEAEVMATETGVVHSQIGHVKRSLGKWMKPQKVSRPLYMIGTRSFIHYEPKGVVLIISPWNYPLNLSIVPLIYAISAGNSVILKPSEVSECTSVYIREMIDELFDESEVAVVEGDASIAQELLKRPFNHIFFTGSPDIGKIIMGEASKNLSGVTLELGGKSPSIIDESADIEQIARRCAWAKFINGGQSCIAPDYLVLNCSVHEPFVDTFKRTIMRLYDPDGRGIQNSPDYCRIINNYHFKRLHSLYQDAIDKGASAVIGGDFDESDLYISPTLLVNVSGDMKIMQEEIFGPLLPVINYQNLNEACDIVLSRPSPLTLYIASKNRDNIDYLIKKTTAGGTVINDYMLGYSNPNLPFGGVNESGIGQSLGFHGFMTFSNPRSVIHRRWGTMSPIYPPYTDFTTRLIKTLYRWFF